jgi:hypothetical protein
MFKVQANSLAEYFDADPARKADLEAMDSLIRKTDSTYRIVSSSAAAQ